MTFYPPKKELMKVEKKFFVIVRKGYQKKRNFALISERCKALGLGKRDKIFPKKRFYENSFSFPFA